MRNVPARIFYFCALIATVTVTLLIVDRYTTSTKVVVSDNLATVPTRPPATSTTTTTDLKPAYEFTANWQRAEVSAFLDAWWASDVTAYVTAVKASQDEWARQAAYARQTATRPVQAPVRTSTAVAKPGPVNAGGMDSRLQCVISRESGGNPRAVNPSSGAAGLGQWLPSSWAAMGFAAKYGVASAAQATPAQQMEAMASTYQRYGMQPWSGGSRPC